MSCRRAESLDALVLGELSGPARNELRVHAERCTVCAHELKWLETEQGLFQQRAARAEVKALWKDLPAAAPSRFRPWSTLAALAASALVVWGVQRAMGHRAIGAQEPELWPMSEEAMSRELPAAVPVSEIGGASGCSGLGFACGPASSPVASRD